VKLGDDGDSVAVEQGGYLIRSLGGYAGASGGAGRRGAGVRQGRPLVAGGVARARRLQYRGSAVFRG